MYNMLFQAVSRTLLEVGERKLHAKLGFLCLLHTWGQTLTPHPHLHVLIPGCGIDSKDGSPRRFHTRLSALRQGLEPGLLRQVRGTLKARLS